MSSESRVEWHKRQTGPKKPLWPKQSPDDTYPLWTHQQRPLDTLLRACNAPEIPAIDGRHKPLKIASSLANLGFPTAYVLGLVPYSLDKPADLPKARPLRVVDTDTQLTHMLYCQLYRRPEMKGEPCNPANPFKTTLIFSWSAPNPLNRLYPDVDEQGREREITMDSCWDCLVDGRKCAKVGLILDGPRADQYIPDSDRVYRSINEMLNIPEKYKVLTAAMERPKQLSLQAEKKRKHRISLDGPSAQKRQSLDRDGGEPSTSADFIWVDETPTSGEMVNSMLEDSSFSKSIAPIFPIDLSVDTITDSLAAGSATAAPFKQPQDGPIRVLSTSTSSTPAEEVASATPSETSHSSETSTSLSPAVDADVPAPTAVLEPSATNTEHKDRPINAPIRILGERARNSLATPGRFIEKSLSITTPPRARKIAPSIPISPILKSNASHNILASPIAAAGQAHAQRLAQISQDLWQTAEDCYLPALKDSIDQLISVQIENDRLAADKAGVEEALASARAVIDRLEKTYDPKVWSELERERDAARAEAAKEREEKGKVVEAMKLAEEQAARQAKERDGAIKAAEDLAAVRLQERDDAEREKQAVVDEARCSLAKSLRLKEQARREAELRVQAEDRERGGQERLVAAQIALDLAERMLRSMGA